MFASLSVSTVPPPSAVSWAPARQVLPAAVTDGTPTTYVLLRVGPAQDPVAFGFEWGSPARVGTIAADFACLGGRSFEPDARSVRVEARHGRTWRAVPFDLNIDTSRRGEIAQFQMRGTVRWTFRFRPIATDGVRVVAPAPAHRDLAYQCIALAGLTTAADGVSEPTGRVSRVGPGFDPPACLRPGANLATPEAGAIAMGGNPFVIAWRKPVVVSEVRVGGDARVTGVEWAGDGRWRPVERLAADGKGGATFAPVCVTSLSIHTKGAPRGRVTVACGPEAADYYEAVRLGRTDILGERFRALERPDLAAMDALLQPINFAKAAIGRPADLVETMVTWTGTFLQLTTGTGKDPNGGADLPAQTLERWVAPVPFDEPPDWFRTHSAYLDGWMPAVVTSYDRGAVQIAQTLFVTAPDAPAYGTVAIVRLRNVSASPRRVRFAYALGVRRVYGDPPTPFVSDPLATSYTFGADRRTVRDASGAIVLHAMQPIGWGGTDRERHVRFETDLAPRQDRTIAFFVPDVTSPMRDEAAVARLDASSLLTGFRRYWTGMMEEAGQIETPERRLNDAARNLLAQCMIVGLDGDTARYGAYHYESYFGLEEGWPAVALAQFGHADYGRKIMDYMLSPACLDKANYHHQYRNGLAPWYAADIVRLAPDRAWLEKIAPALRQCADWTIARIEENKDPKWGGILPRHAYGGDIGMPAYSFYANATCWRGLHDTALVMGVLGDTEASRRYAEAAERYRKRLIELADSLADRSSEPTFLPMSFGLIHAGAEREKEPTYAVLASDAPYSDLWTYLGNYWNLFAPCFQELRLFPVTDPRSRWVPDTMQVRGGVCSGQVRFANGLDAVYGKGYIQSLLDHGLRDEFATSLYGMSSAAMSRDLFSGPEVSGVFPLRTNNLAIWREHARERWFWAYRYGGAWAQGWQNQEGEPLSALAGMALQLLRSALVREDYAADPPTDLRLMDGAPRIWFEPGNKMAARRMPTFFGTVSVEVECRADGATARLEVSPAFTARRIIIRLPSPDGRVIASATVNGKPTEPMSSDEVALDSPSGTQTIEVRWR